MFPKSTTRKAVDAMNLLRAKARGGSPHSITERVLHALKKHFSASLLLILFLLTACFKVDLPACENVFQVRIRVLNTLGEDITSRGEAGDVTLYVFDQDTLYLGQLQIPSAQVQRKQAIELSYPETQVIYVVAWGNLSGNQSVSQLSLGDRLQDALVRLRRDPAGYVLSPDDLFHGIKLAGSVATRQTNLMDLKIVRKVARMHISVRGVPPDAPEKFYFVVGGTKVDAFNFLGELVGDTVRLRQNGLFTSLNGLFVSPAFNAYPSTAAGQASVYLYKNDVLLAKADRDEDDHPIVLLPGVTTNVLIDYSIEQADVEVIIKVTDWDKLYQWSEW